MYICENKHTFDTPIKEVDDIGYPYDVCPICGDDRIDEATPCKQCSDPKVKDGDDYCEDCLTFAMADIMACLQELSEVDGWDRELLLDAMQAILED